MNQDNSQFSQEAFFSQPTTVAQQSNLFSKLLGNQLTSIVRNIITGFMGVNRYPGTHLSPITRTAKLGMGTRGNKTLIMSCRARIGSVGILLSIAISDLNGDYANLGTRTKFGQVPGQLF